MSSHAYYTMFSSHMSRRIMSRQKSPSSHDESTESKIRVNRVLMNRMNRKLESIES